MFFGHKRKLPDEPDFRRDKSGIIKGRFNDDPRAIALMVRPLGVVFISKNGVSIATSEEIKRDVH